MLYSEQVFFTLYIETVGLDDPNCKRNIEMGSLEMLSRRTMGTDMPVMAQVNLLLGIRSCFFFLFYVRNTVGFCVQIRKLMAELTNPMSLAQVCPLSLSLSVWPIGKLILLPCHCFIDNKRHNRVHVITGSGALAASSKGFRQGQGACL